MKGKYLQEIKSYKAHIVKTMTKGLKYCAFLHDLRMRLIQQEQKNLKVTFIETLQEMFKKDRISASLC